MNKQDALQEDIHLITKLLETLTINDIAEKWDVKFHDVALFMRRNNLSSVRIRREKRIHDIMRHPGKTAFELSILLDCDKNTITDTLRAMKAGAGGCYESSSNSKASAYVSNFKRSDKEDCIRRLKSVATSKPIGDDTLYYLDDGSIAIHRPIVNELQLFKS